MKIIKLIVILILFIVVRAQGESPYVVVLGVAQDAGAPQMGCISQFCKNAWTNKSLRRMVSSIALVNPDTKQRWIFDATPNLPEQFQNLKTKTNDFSNNLDGIFITHAHIGHYTGLMFLGRESMNAKAVKVFAMPRMMQMLEQNAPWSQLVDLGNIKIREIQDKHIVSLNEQIRVTAFIVPHRDEFSETVGYEIESSNKKLIFIPDIDKWEKWDQKLSEVIKNCDFAFVDATFYKDGEIPRPMSEVPHPFVSETMELLKALPLNEKKKVHFIHFNHSNPIVQGNREIINEVRKKGFNIAYEGQIVKL